MRPKVKGRAPQLFTSIKEGLYDTDRSDRFRPEADIGFSLNIQMLIRFGMNWTDVDHGSTGGLFLVLSCMDAPENARIFERIQRVRIAVMYPACLRGLVTAGLDGIRLLKGRGRDAQSTYRALCSDKTSG